MADEYFTEYKKKGNYVPFCSSPTVRYHGGKCCGVKEIVGFSYQPSTMVSEYEPDLTSKEWWLGRDLDGEDTGTFTSLCNEKRPPETALERLKAVIANIVKRQEGVLFRAHLLGCQEKEWADELMDLGFTFDLDFVNSNSGNRIYCYSLLYQGGKVVKTKKEG